MCMCNALVHASLFTYSGFAYMVPDSVMKVCMDWEFSLSYGRIALFDSHFEQSGSDGDEASIDTLSERISTDAMLERIAQDFIY